MSLRSDVPGRLVRTRGIRLCSRISEDQDQGVGAGSILKLLRAGQRGAASFNARGYVIAPVRLQALLSFTNKRLLGIMSHDESITAAAPAEVDQLEVDQKGKGDVLMLEELDRNAPGQDLKIDHVPQSDTANLTQRQAYRKFWKVGPYMDVRVNTLLTPYRQLYSASWSRLVQ